MGRVGKGPHGWTSRDYNIEVPCKCTTCPANSAHHVPASHRMICNMPSSITIAADGHCEQYDVLKEAFKNKQPKKPDGD